MKITICGSIAFFKEMLEVKKQLEDMGCEVKLPPSEIRDNNGKVMPVEEYYQIRKSEGQVPSWVWDVKKEAILAHFRKVDWCDAILVLNIEKNGTPGYIGSNTLMEMGLALYLGKKIYLLNSVPEIGCKEEILGMQPEIINGDLNQIK